MNPWLSVEAFGSTILFPFFAHQGGWDEILLVAAPLAFIGLLLWLANKRVDAKLETQAQDGATHPDKTDAG